MQLYFLKVHHPKCHAVRRQRLQCAKDARAKIAAEELPRVLSEPFVGDLSQQVVIFPLNVSRYWAALLTLSIPAQQIQAHVGDNAIYPGGKCALVSKVSQVLEDFQECLLINDLSIALRTGDPKRELQNACIVKMNQLHKRGAVTRLRLANQREVAIIACDLHCRPPVNHSGRPHESPP